MEVFWERDALRGLWLWASLQNHSGALGWLEPRLIESETGLSTDGKLLRVGRNVLHEWLSHSEPRTAVATLQRVGLELLEAWRGTALPWPLPRSDRPVEKDSGGAGLVMHRPVLAEQMVAWLQFGTVPSQEWDVPPECLPLARWWGQLNQGWAPGSTAEGHRWMIQPPPWATDASHPWNVDAAQALWRRAQRRLRAQGFRFDSSEETALSRIHLTTAPEEESEWFDQHPSPKVPADALFLCRNPGRVAQMLTAGADPKARQCGQDVIAHACCNAPHMVEPLMEAGLQSECSSWELMRALSAFDAPHEMDVRLHLARLFLPCESQPSDWAPWVGPILQRAFERDCPRLDWLNALWSEVPDAKSVLAAVRIDRTVPNHPKPDTPVALAALALVAVERGRMTLEEAGRRLQVLCQMGVAFDRPQKIVHNGTLFHAVLPVTQTPQGASLAYQLFSPLGVAWESLDKKGRRPLEASYWKKHPDRFDLSFIVADQKRRAMEQHVAQSETTVRSRMRL